MTGRMCSEMVERVARAIARASYSSDQWDNLSEAQQITFFSEARVAIEAMREPTEAMKQTGSSEGDWAEGSPQSEAAEQRWRESAAREVWAAMIEEALQ